MKRDFETTFTKQLTIFFLLCASSIIVFNTIQIDIDPKFCNLFSLVLGCLGGIISFYKCNDRVPTSIEIASLSWKSLLVAIMVSMIATVLIIVQSNDVYLSGFIKDIQLPILLIPLVIVTIIYYVVIRVSYVVFAKVISQTEAKKG